MILKEIQIRHDDLQSELYLIVPIRYPNDTWDSNANRVPSGPRRACKDKIILVPFDVSQYPKGEDCGNGHMILDSNCNHCIKRLKKNVEESIISVRSCVGRYPYNIKLFLNLCPENLKIIPLLNNTTPKIIRNYVVKNTNITVYYTILPLLRDLMDLSWKDIELNISIIIPDE